MGNYKKEKRTAYLIRFDRVGLLKRLTRAEKGYIFEQQFIYNTTGSYDLSEIDGFGSDRKHLILPVLDLLEEDHLKDIAEWKVKSDNLSKNGKKGAEAKKKKKEAKQGKPVEDSTEDFNAKAEEVQVSDGCPKDSDTIPKKGMAEAVFSVYNEYATKVGATPVRSLSGDRRNKINGRIKEHGFEQVVYAIKKITDEAFFKGSFERENIKWLTLDWLFKPTKHAIEGILNGKYSIDYGAEKQPKPVEGGRFNTVEGESEVKVHRF